MDYGSLTFIFLFLPVTLLIYFVIPARKRTARNIVLFLFSILFYAWGNVAYTAILLFSIGCNYLIALDMDRRLHNGKLRSGRSIYHFGLFFNIVLVLFFGYFGFFIDVLNRIFHDSISVKTIAIPIGVLIYTMSAIAYLVDIYRGKLKAERNFLYFGLYMAFFPRIIAGPFIKYQQISGQFRERKEDLKTAMEGMGRFLSGLLKFVILGGIMRGTWEKISEQTSIAAVTAWIGILAFAFVFYFTYSGYADMAIGLGRIFGFKIRENFNYPYLATNLKEFWMRWNMSVTGWFRQYIFRPLGGARGSAGSYIKNMLVMYAAMGLWYGPTLNFLLGGVYMAVFLVLEELIYGRFMKKLPRVIRHIYMILVVGVGFTFFGTDTVSGAFQYIRTMFGGSGSFWNAGSWYFLRTNLISIIICTIAVFPIARMLEKKVRSIIGTIGLGLIVILLILGVIIRDQDYSNKEGRYLQRMPAVSTDRLLEGNAQNDAEQYLKDQFPFRNLWLDIQTVGSRLLGFREKNDIYRGSDNTLIAEFKEPDRALMKNQANAINSFAAQHADRIKTYMIVVPTAAEIYSEKLPSGAPNADMEAYRDAFGKELDAAVEYLDVSTALKTHVEEELYYRTDSNWTSLAAYYAYRDAGQKMGIDMSNDNYEAAPVTESFRGNLAMQSGYSVTKDSINVYFPQDSSFRQVLECVLEKTKSVSPYSSAALESNYKYDVFYGGDHALMRINSTSAAKERILVIKDSYGNSFIPFLTGAYREVVVVDPRLFYGNLEELIVNENITNVLFLYSAGNLSTDRALVPILQTEEVVEQQEGFIDNSSGIDAVEDIADGSSGSTGEEAAAESTDSADHAEDAAGAEDIAGAEE